MLCGASSSIFMRRWAGGNVDNILMRVSNPVFPKVRIKLESAEGLGWHNEQTRVAQFLRCRPSSRKGISAPHSFEYRRRKRVKVIVEECAHVCSVVEHANPDRAQTDQKLLCFWRQDLKSWPRFVRRINVGLEIKHHNHNHRTQRKYLGSVTTRRSKI